MATRISCPRCGRQLLLPADCTAELLSCPRCLGQVNNPQAARPSTAVQTEAPPPSPVTGSSPRARESICPACGRAVERSWRRCPHCEEPLLPRSPFEAKESLDTEVRRESRGGMVAAIVLGGLLLLGLILFASSGGFRLVSVSKEGPTVFGMGVVMLGIIAAGTIAVVATSKNRVLTGVTGILGGLAIGAGMVVLFIFLLCLGITQTCQFGR